MTLAVLRALQKDAQGRGTGIRQPMTWWCIGVLGDHRQFQRDWTNPIIAVGILKETGFKAAEMYLQHCCVYKYIKSVYMVIGMHTYMN